MNVLKKRLRLPLTWRHAIRSSVLGEIKLHDIRMAAGCVKCHSAVPGRVCPDCFHCRACGSGCAECAEQRLR
jgi:hypothetical protein